jgi:GntR family transcriptional regulator
MDRLKNEGVIDRQHGRGTFVRSTKLVSQLHNQQNFFDQLQFDPLQHSAQPVVWQLLDHGFFPAPPKVAEWFHLESNSLHFQAALLLKTAGEAVGYHHIGVRRELAIRDNAEQLDEQYLLNYLRELPGQHDCHCRRGFEAISAGEEEARWLGVAVGSPVLMVDHLYTDAAGQVVQFIRSFCRGDRFRYNL